MTADKTKINKILFLVIFVLLLVILLIYFIVDRKEKGVTEPVPEEEGEVILIELDEALPPVDIDKDTGFEEAINQLNTPEKLISYLNNNFIFEAGMAENVLYPEEFFAGKKGNSWDFAVFASYILRLHGYETGIVRYKYNKTINAVSLFGGKVAPQAIIFSAQGADMYEYGFYIREMLEKEQERLDIKIKEYTLSYWTDAGDLWPEEWIEI